jgi:hypothetical protein
MKITTFLPALLPIIVMMGGYIEHLLNRNYTIITVEDCVTNEWYKWEFTKGGMPDELEENLIREKCWKRMGASIHTDTNFINF